MWSSFGSPGGGLGGDEVGGDMGTSITITLDLEDLETLRALVDAGNNLRAKDFEGRDIQVSHHLLEDAQEWGTDMRVGRASNPIPAHWADDVTDEQLAALHEYAELNGSRWKAQLGQDWMRAGSSYAGYAVLHRLRNSHGPTWLATVKLPHGYPWPRP